MRQLNELTMLDRPCSCCSNLSLNWATAITNKLCKVSELNLLCALLEIADWINCVICIYRPADIQACTCSTYCMQLHINLLKDAQNNSNKLFRFDLQQKFVSEILFDLCEGFSSSAVFYPLCILLQPSTTIAKTCSTQEC